MGKIGGCFNPGTAYMVPGGGGGGGGSKFIFSR